MIVSISFSYYSLKKGRFWKLFFLLEHSSNDFFFFKSALIVCSLILQTVIFKCYRSLKCVGITNDSMLAFSECADLLFLLIFLLMFFFF